MAVYTDTVHLVADTITELHEFAAKVGLPRNYYEGVKKGHPHYDVRRGMSKPDWKYGGMIYLVLAAGAQFRTKRQILILSKKMLQNDQQQQEVERARSFFFQDWKKVWVAPPDQCTGCCDIRDGMMFRSCKGCGWSDL